MLILTRKINEMLVIGDYEMTIKVLGVKGGQIRLGIEAPKSLPVHRKEIYTRIKQEQAFGPLLIRPRAMVGNFKQAINH